MINSKSKRENLGRAGRGDGRDGGEEGGIVDGEGDVDGGGEVKVVPVYHMLM